MYVVICTIIVVGVILCFSLILDHRLAMEKEKTEQKRLDKESEKIR